MYLYLGSERRSSVKTETCFKGACNFIDRSEQKFSEFCNTLQRKQKAFMKFKLLVTISPLYRMLVACGKMRDFFPFFHTCGVPSVCSSPWGEWDYTSLHRRKVLLNLVSIKGITATKKRVIEIWTNCVRWHHKKINNNNNNNNNKPPHVHSSWTQQEECCFWSQ